MEILNSKTLSKSGCKLNSGPALGAGRSPTDEFSGDK